MSPISRINALPAVSATGRLVTSKPEWQHLPLRPRPQAQRPAPSPAVKDMDFSALELRLLGSR